MLEEVECFFGFDAGFGTDAALGEEFSRLVEPGQNGGGVLPIEAAAVDLFRVIMRALWQKGRLEARFRETQSQGAWRKAPTLWSRQLQALLHPQDQPNVWCAPIRY